MPNLLICFYLAIADRGCDSSTRRVAAKLFTMSCRRQKPDALTVSDLTFIFIAFVIDAGRSRFAGVAHRSCELVLDGGAIR